MAGGNAVCGSSAIGAIAPAIQADDEEKGADHHTRQFVRNSDDVDFAVSWSGVVWFGCFTKSALLGGTLQSVGQVVAGASTLMQRLSNMPCCLRSLGSFYWSWWF